MEEPKETSLMCLNCEIKCKVINLHEKDEMVKKKKTSINILACISSNDILNRVAMISDRTKRGARIWRQTQNLQCNISQINM